jgi:hypothetical protein
MDYNIDQNRLVFIKTGKAGPDLFYRFTENQSVQFEILKFFEKSKTKKIEQ